MATNIKQKEIQIQKPAQSLEAFKAKAAAQTTEHEGLLKPLAIIGGAVVAVIILISAFSAWRSKRIERHETALAELMIEVQGDPSKPSSPADIEKRMRERLPRLEALAKSAPGARKADTEATLSTWKLQLDGKGAVAASTDDPWARLALAQRQIALAQGKEALATLEPLRSKAQPGKPWAHLFWTNLMEVHRLQGTRDQAWKDFVEYKKRFEDQAEVATIERILSGI